MIHAEPVPVREAATTPGAVRRRPILERWQTCQPSPINVRHTDADGAGLFAPRRRKICIIGNGPTRAAADLLLDPAYEVWAMNAILPLDASGRARADRWFDLHQRCSQNEDDLSWIRACPLPIYVPDDLLSESPRAVPYPLAAIEAKFGLAYWSCTFAYQIALALFEGAAEIALRGVDLHLGNMRERTVEYACVSAWLGIAHARGVVVNVPASDYGGLLPAGFSLLGHPARYGIEYEAEAAAVREYELLLSAADAARSYEAIEAQILRARLSRGAVESVFPPAGGIGG